MSDKFKNLYDDGNIPEIDLPQKDEVKTPQGPHIVNPLPESERPRKDGPGGES